MHEDSHIQSVNERMVDALFEKLRQEFGERGTYATEMLKTAKWLLGQEERAPRTALAAAYCIRQALVEILQNKGIRKDSWRALSRKVVKAKQDINVENPTREELNLFRAVDDLEEFHNSERMHLIRFKAMIRYLTGNEPLDGKISPVKVYDRTIQQTNTLLHRVSASIEGDASTVSTHYLKTIETLTAVFLPLKRLDDITELAELPEPQEKHARRLKEIMISPNDIDYFASKMKSPDWLRMLDYDMLKPKPDDSPWLIQSIANHMNDDRLDAFVSFVNKNWRDWAGESAGLRKLAHVGFTLGDSGLQFLVNALQEDHKSKEICRYASIACSEAKPSNPCVAKLADLLLNPDSGLDYYNRTITVPVKLVEGMDLSSSPNRIMILVDNIYKLRERDERFYIRPSQSIANLDMNSPRVINALVGHLRDAVAKGRELGNPTQLLVGMLECLPENVKSRLVAWLYSNTDDVDHSSLVDFVESSCRSRLPTRDDILMLDRMKRNDIMKSVAVRLAGVIGKLPEPEDLDYDARQNRSYREDKRRALWAAAMGNEVNLPGWEKFLGMLNERVMRLNSPMPTYTSSRSPFDREIFDSEDPYVLAGMIEAWRPGVANGPNPPSVAGICSELQEAVKRLPDRWAKNPVRIIEILKHPTYVVGYFRGLTQVEDWHGKRADEVIRAIRLARMHPWPVVSLNSSQFEYDHDWQNADVAGMDLIEVLARINAKLNGESLSYVWKIVIKEAMDTTGESVGNAESTDMSLVSDLLGYEARPAENVDPAKQADTLEDHMFAATNKPRTRAIQTMIYLIRRAKTQDNVSRQALAVLTKALLLTGPDGVEHRAIIASHAGLLCRFLPEWFEQNESRLFGSMAPEDLAQVSFDMYLGWNNPDEVMLGRYRDEILDAVCRNADRAMDHLLLGMFWHMDGYDQEFLIKKLVNMGPEFVSRAGEQASRLLRDATDADLIMHGISFWKDVLDSSSDPRELAGFGMWALVSALEHDEWECLTLKTCKMAEGKLDWAWTVAERITTAPRITETGLRILKLMIRSDLDIMNASLVAEHASKALHKSKDDMEIRASWNLLRDAMVDRGLYHDF